MPIKIPEQLPAYEVLKAEHIFVMDDERAIHQDIRPLKIAILNLEPSKIATETQLLRLLGNTSLQVEVTLLRTSTYQSKETPAEHLWNFYQKFDQIGREYFDGLIITGAPVEHLAFEQVEYWEELKAFLNWSINHVFARLYIGWSAQAALFHHFGVPKHPSEVKHFGVYKHQVVEQDVDLLRGFDDTFFAPHSHQTEVRRADIEKVLDLRILAESKKAGVYIVESSLNRQVFITGQPEYDALTLKNEYESNLVAGLPSAIPANYFTENNPGKSPVVRWRGHSNLLFANWINYCVYQETPYEIIQFNHYATARL